MNFLVDDKLNVTPLRIFIHQTELRVTYKLYPRPQFLTRGSRLIYARSNNEIRPEQTNKSTIISEKGKIQILFISKGRKVGRKV